MTERLTPGGAQFQETVTAERLTPCGEMIADGAAPAPDSPAPDSPAPDSPVVSTYAAYQFLFGG